MSGLGNGSKNAYLSWGSPLFNAALLLIVLAVGLSIALLPLTLAGGAVLGSIIFLATLIRPEYSLYLLILAVPFGSVREIAISGLTVGAAEALVGLVLAAWLAKMIVAREVKIIYPPLVLSLLIFLVAILLSLTGTLSLRYSFKEILKWLEVLGIYLFVANVIEREQAKVVVLLMLLAGIGQALLGFYQFFGRVGPPAFVVLGRFVRAYGTFEQPNPYGGYLGLVLPLAWGVLLGIGTLVNWETSKLVTSLPIYQSTNLPLAILGLATMGTALIMSWSRGAWLGFAAALIVMNLAYSRRVAALFALLCLLVASVLLLGGSQMLPQTIIQRLTDFLPYLHGLDVGAVKVSPANYAMLERMAHWQAAWGMFSDRPWLGVGIGNYEPVYPAYALQGWPLALGHAHNYYLNIAAETGLIGLAAYLALWGAAFWQAWKAVRATQGYWRGVAVGILGVLTHLAVHNFFDNLYVHNMYLHVAILLGLLFIMTNDQL